MPASASEIALRQYRVQRRLKRGLITEARRLWRQLGPREVRAMGGSWTEARNRLLVLLAAAQTTGARQAEQYVTAVLAAQGIDPAPSGVLVPEALAWIASDGRPLDTLLDSAPIAMRVAVGEGATEQRAYAAGYGTLDMILATQAADAARVAAGVSLTARRRAGGYVRMIVGKTCSRCVILAGRWYRWNAGFQRHPRCDCIHIPSRENRAGDIQTDPQAYFKSLGRADQDKIFTKAGAQAIRDGADMSRVVNARRGMETAARAQGGTGGRLTTRDVFGRQLATTTEAVTKRGINRQIRLMPEEVYRIAGTDRDEALRLLRVHGYIR